MLELKKQKEVSSDRVLSVRSQGLEETDAIQLVEQVNVMIDFSGNALHSINDLLQSFNFSRLRKLDLSNIKIEEVPDKKCLSNLVSLQVLYLHMNQIADWKYLEYFAALPPSILHITLFCNSVVNRSGYRHFVVSEKEM